MTILIKSDGNGLITVDGHPEGVRETALDLAEAIFKGTICWASHLKRAADLHRFAPASKHRCFVWKIPVNVLRCMSEGSDAVIMVFLYIMVSQTGGI